MSEPVKVNFKVYQGSTFTKVLRWELPTKVYKPISAVFNTAPLVIQSTSHGMPVGWRFKVSNVVGTKELNSEEYLIATGTTSDSITVNSVNATGYTTYISGGIIEYNEPKSLAATTARMQIRLKVNSTDTVLELTTENGGIVIDDSSKTITIIITAAQTTALSFKSAVYSLEIIEGSIVTPFIYGSLTLDAEITR